MSTGKRCGWLIELQDMKVKAVLLQPPFFKCVGSHNDRVLLELAYASRILNDAGIDHMVVNSDFLGSDRYVPWRDLFDNDSLWRQACEGTSPEFSQCVEQVMQFSPDVVVISAGDSCIPTKDFGSPYIAAHLSKTFRSYGVKTIALGPMFIRDPETFKKDFDRMFLSVVNRSLVDVVLDEDCDVITGTPIGILPLFNRTFPQGSLTDYVLSSFGCVHNCSFCMARDVSHGNVTFQSNDIFLSDISDRSNQIGRDRLYIADMIFPLNVRRLKVLADRLEGSQYRFSCESRVDNIREVTVGLMKRIGVRNVKLGIESLNDTVLENINKKSKVADQARALDLLKEYDFEVTGYLIFGDFYQDEAGMLRTIEKAGELPVDFWVVNISSYQTFGWDERKYDAHWSRSSAYRQGLSDSVIDAALSLQEKKKHPTVDVLEVGDENFVGTSL